jgi:hypothetical protein
MENRPEILRVLRAGRVDSRKNNLDTVLAFLLKVAGQLKFKFHTKK